MKTNEMTSVIATVLNDAYESGWDTEPEFWIQTTALKIAEAIGAGKPAAKAKPAAEAEAEAEA